MKSKIVLCALLCYSMVSAQWTPEVKLTEETSKNTNFIKNEASLKWAAKVDVFLMGLGEIPVSVEYRLAKKLSIEATAGITYSIFPNNFLRINSEIDPYGNDTKAGFGSVFRGTIKFYPSAEDEALEGWNIGIQVFRKSNVRNYDNANYIPEDKKDIKVKTGIAIIVGKQFFYDSLVFEPFFGVGYHKMKRTFYGDVPDTADSILYYAPKELKENQLNFQLGFRIGFGG